MTPRFAPSAAGACPITPVAPDGLDDLRSALTPRHAAWMTAMGFTADLGEVCPLPSDTGAIERVLLGVGTHAARGRTRFALGNAVADLPEGVYALESAKALPAPDAAELALGYLFSLYRFDRYRSQSAPLALLQAPTGIDETRFETIAAGEALTRDLINTPARDMGPDALEDAARDLGQGFGAAVAVTTGDALLTDNHPMIHAVGRAADRAPRLIDLTWGRTGPRLTLVGKGVCFDTGGLNLKPGASMGLMKKDMGGAAAVLGLAHMIMALGLGLRLRVLIPAVENAVSGAAFRPGDILTARNGMTVEVNNTDAEGRLVLADALALANEAPADLTLCMATLTGAARVAVGPDIAPFFTDDDAFADSLAQAAAAVRDPVWRLPFHAPYGASIEPGIADLDNAPKGGFAGAIAAALFLHRFVPDCPRFAHFDIYGWQPAAAPGRPKGGVGQAARAILDALPEVLDL